MIATFLVAGTATVGAIEYQDDRPDQIVGAISDIDSNPSQGLESL